MDLIEFLKLNIVTMGGVLLFVLVYLVILINRRRKEQFLHRQSSDKR